VLDDTGLDDTAGLDDEAPAVGPLEPVEVVVPHAATVAAEARAAATIQNRFRVPTVPPSLAGHVPACNANANAAES
jgi:hypothetical protein